MVPGCPDTLIENNIRSAAIEFCEKTGVYQAELDPVTTVANIYEYDLEPPSGTVVHKVMWVDNAGTPQYFVKNSQSLFWLVPVPQATSPSSTVLRVQLKPTHTSTACDDDVMTDYREAIINGALTRLLRMPSREWTDYNGASVFNSLFAQGIQDAERRARHADEGVARKVNYGGIYSRVSSKRNRYGRGG
jgi:hypothetical protein